MRDVWYGDNRDLIKWGILLRLAEFFEAGRILQLAFYRPSEFGRLIIDGQEHDIPECLIAHFRNLRAIESIGSKVRVTVFDALFQDRPTYLEAAKFLLQKFPQERCIAFLDPDTGLEPAREPSLKHVLASEAGAIWDAMKAGDIFVFYQHQTNRAGRPWIKAKQSQLAGAIGIPVKSVKVARGPSIAKDVAFFYIEKMRKLGKRRRGMTTNPARTLNQVISQ
jgi:hypothetical protein